jgi:hypothetical protein
MNLMGQRLNNIELGQSPDAILMKFDNLPLANILFVSITGKTSVLAGCKKLAQASACAMSLQASA